MFEKETEQLISVIRLNTIGDAPAVSLRAIFESKVPSNVKSFFRAEVESLLDAERKVTLKSARFNAEIPEVQMLEEQIESLLIQNFVFSKTDFDLTLDKCVHFLFNYLCRPQWTLSSFLFEDPSVKVPARQLVNKLRYCRDYAYFPDIVRRYLKDRVVVEMSSSDGSSLLDKIDAEVIRGYSSVELAQMTQPLFDFIAFARTGDLRGSGATIPTRALVYFFEDKKMSAVHQRLAQERDVNGRKELTFRQLANLLEKVRTGDQYAHVFDEDDDPSPSENELLPEEETVLPAESYGYESTRKPGEPPRPLPPIFSLEEERTIIKHVFHENEDQFHSAVEESLAAESWEDAAHSIDHYFLMNDVQPFTREAILFTNRIQGRFNEQSAKG